MTYTTARIVWEPPLEPNGVISLYRVTYKEKESDGGTPETVELGDNNREYTAENLKGNTYYKFSVMAQTMLGWGEEASVTVITMVNRSKFLLCNSKNYAFVKSANAFSYCEITLKINVHHSGTVQIWVR